MVVTDVSFCTTMFVYFCFTLANSMLKTFETSENVESKSYIIVARASSSSDQLSMKRGHELSEHNKYYACNRSVTALVFEYLSASYKSSHYSCDLIFLVSLSR